MKRFFCFSLTSLCLACAFSSELSASPEIQYAFTTIDFPAAGIIGQVATAVNDRGQIAGGWEVGTTLRGYLYEEGQFTIVDINHQGAAIRGINNRNELSGFFGDNRGIHGFLFDLHRGIRTEISVPEANLTECIGLNDYSEVVCDYRDMATGIFHGVLWTPSGVFHRIDFPGATATGPSDINNQRQIVGFYDLNNNPNGDRHGFLFDPIRGFATIEIARPDARLTLPLAINDNSEIAGIYIDATGSHGFVFDGNTFTVIDFPVAGVTLTDIWGIDNVGTIVGSYIDSAQKQHGFVAVRLLL